MELGKIELGRYDGKKEAARIDNFEDLFFDYNNIYETAIDRETFIVLGKKGTGKTLLAELIKKKCNEDTMKFCRLESYKKYDLTELQKLKNGEVIVDEYVPIWKWVSLIELSKLVVMNEGLAHKKGVSRLKSFLSEHGFSTKLNSFKTITKTQEINTTGTWQKVISICKGKKEDKKPKSYLELIEPLKDTLIEILYGSEHEYVLMYDELDDKFENNETYKNSIIGLIKVAEELNMAFVDENINFKILLFLRKDIFGLLHYSDLNKIVEDSSLELDWGENRSINSPILQLFTNKTKKSIVELKDSTHKEIMKKFFSKEEMRVSDYTKVPIYTYILDRTLMRPRDLISYIKKIQKKYGSSQYITQTMVREIEKEYSKYFLKELSDELVGHLYKDDVLGMFNLIKAYGRPTFTLKNISNYYNLHKKDYPEMDVEVILKQFYKVGAIGTKKKNRRLNKWIYSWGYRELDFAANLDDTICVIHNGLKKELSLR